MEIYCRKCMKTLPEDKFYQCYDARWVDSNGKLSVCKPCIQSLYDTLYSELSSMEKSIHKLCTTLNIKYSNDAMSATRAHIDTLLQKGSVVNSVFGIYLMKLTATNPSMDKSAKVDMSYSDVGTIFTTEQINVKETPIPQEVLDRWGKQKSREDYEFLEREYMNFKNTHKVDTYTVEVLVKEICFTMLEIKNKRETNDDYEDAQKALQQLLKNGGLTPNSKGKDADRDTVAIGLWIKDIEELEPAEWLRSDPRGDMYRDVADVDSYFQKYHVRPAKNFIAQSKDFNIDEEENLDDDMLTAEETPDYGLVDDGIIEE
jgi:hypothetical protein